MHKLLSQVLPKPKQFTYTPGMHAALERPSLAIEVSALFALSVEIEQTKAEIFIYLLEGEPRAGMDLFLSLRGGQRSALRAVVKSKMSSKYATLLEKVMEYADDKFTVHRDKFAHWEWAMCHQLPNHICLIEPRANAEYSVARMEHSPEIKRTGDTTALGHALDAHSESMRGSIHVYDSASLLAIADKGAMAFELITSFVLVVTARTDPEREQRFFELKAQLQQAGV